VLSGRPRPARAALWRRLRGALAAASGCLAAGLAIAQAGGDWLQLRVEAQHHTATVRRVAVSPDGVQFATVGDDKTARLWRAADGRLLATLRVPIGAGDVGRLSALAYSPDGREIAVAGIDGDPTSPHRIHVFDAANGGALRTLRVDGGHIVRLAWLGNGSIAACLSGRHGVRVLSRDGFLQLSEDFGATCYGLAALPDGSLLASGYDGAIRHYRADARGAWQPVRRFTTEPADARSLAPSPDGRWLAVGYGSLPAGTAAVVDVYDLAVGTRARRFTFSDLRHGQPGAVAWSADGQTIAAAGAGTHGDRVHVLKRIAWPQGEVASDTVATNTVQDIAPLGAAAFVLASSNGNWGMVPARGAVAAFGSPILDLAGPETLRADDKLGTVAFGGAGPHGAMHFKLKSRTLAAGDPGGLSGARRFAFGLSVADWENRPRPTVAGRAVPMEPLELSRAFALLPSADGALLATSRRLRRFDGNGQERWSTRTATEVMTVSASADGKLVVGTQLDGTVRWWRADDGMLLLSLFVTLDGRWVLWTEQGYFDAAAGAEPLIGWHLQRPDGGVDFFSAGRFRDKYHRPDVIDRVLETLDVKVALAQADEQRRRYADADAGTVVAVAPPPVVVAPPTAPPVPQPLPIPQRPLPSPTATPTAPAPPAPAVPAAPLATPPAPLPDPVEQRLPPVVAVLTERALRSDQQLLRVQFTLRSAFAPADEMLVRIDGRPAELQSITMPERQDGQSVGQLTVRMPEADAQVAVIAQAGSLASEPVFLAWSWRPPQVPVPPVAPAAPGRPSVAAAPATVQAALPRPPGPPPPPQAAVAPAPAAAAPARLPLRGQLYVVAVGVSEYAKKEYALALAAKDATDFSALMSAQAGRLYTRVERRLLTDRQATRASVLEALDWLRRSVGPEDTGMLFIAGHGVNDNAGHYHFMPHDADVDRLARTAVGETELRRSLAGIKGRAVLFVDTCHAGNVVGSGAAAGQEIGRLANTLSSAENGVIVFSASTGRQESYEQTRWGNGAFTKALIDGLRGAADFARDGVVTHQGLSYFLGREVRRLTRGTQTPVTAVPLGVVDFPVVALSGAS